MAEDVDADPEERIEELETQVAELEATVRGLTEELVDRTERVRQLERQAGIAGGVEGNPEPGAGLTAEEEVGSEPDAEAEATEPEQPAEEDKGAEAEGQDNGEDSGEGDDIIVA